MKRFVTIAWFGILAACLPLTLQASDDAVYFIGLEDGATVPQTFTVRFGLRGWGVAPAGVAKEKTGHHHVLIDMTFDELDPELPMPASDKLKHFGAGQTETELTLSPGKHTLQLVLGDASHIPAGKQLVSKVITITVK